MSSAFFTDVRRCAKKDKAHGGVARLLASNYGLQALLAYRLGRRLLRAGGSFYVDVWLELSADTSPDFYMGQPAEP